MHTSESIKHLEELIAYHVQQEKMSRDWANRHRAQADEHWRQAATLKDTLRRVREESAPEA
jgi:hypothetical protein